MVLKRNSKLLKSMTVSQFENGYWYATELKQFADNIGIPSAGKLRKDELERAIIHFLKTGKVQSPTQRSLSKTGTRDIDVGLSLKLRVVNYTSNKETKRFIEAAARKIAPELKRKSGASYRLNRWREEQLTSGTKITYGDLVKQYVKLNQSEGRFAKIPSGRYINFLSDFLAKENGATRDQAISAWKALKKMDVPKDYPSWVESKASAKKSK
jgi:SAP domain-containing new25